MAQPLERVPRRLLSGAVFDQLLDRIVGGTFKPGQPLPAERLLCAELGVSRTAVREALARLVELRLIQVRHGGETLVLDFRATAGLDLLPRLMSRGDLQTRSLVVQSGLQMRAALTPEIAKLAASPTRDLDTAPLFEVIAEMAAARDDLAALQLLSLRFWALVVDFSGNLAYQLAFNSLRDAFMALREAAAEAMAAELRDRKGYKAIAEAIRDGDEAAAERASRAHIALGMDGLAALFRDPTPRARRKRSA